MALNQHYKQVLVDMPFGVAATSAASRTFCGDVLDGRRAAASQAGFKTVVSLVSVGSRFRPLIFAKKRTSSPYCYAIIIGKIHPLQVFL